MRQKLPRITKNIFSEMLDLTSMRLFLLVMWLLISFEGLRESFACKELELHLNVIFLPLVILFGIEEMRIAEKSKYDDGASAI